MADLTSRVRERLNTVPDACSMSQTEAIGLSDMGLIREVRVTEAEAGRWNVALTMRVTAPGCMYVPFMDRSIKVALGEMHEIASVSTYWEPTADWTPADIAEPVRRRMEEARQRRREKLAQMRRPSGNASSSPAGSAA